MQKQTETIKTQETEEKASTVNPRALEVISSLSEEPDSLQFTIEDIGDEQCVVARVSKLTEETMADFEGAGESEDPTLKSNWRDISREIELLGGVGDTEVQAVRTGKTGRQKEVQVALFGLHNTAELMDSIIQLNDLRKNDGVEPQEAVPGDLAYLPDNILIATRDLRANTGRDLERVTSSTQQAVGAGVVAFSGKMSNLH